MSTPREPIQPTIDDPHAVLGVPRSASRRQIASAYRRLAKRHHPDVDSDPGAADRMRRINAAWRQLSDPGTPGRRPTHATSSAHWPAGRSSVPPRATRTHESWTTWGSRTATYHAFDRPARFSARIRDPLRPPQRLPAEARFQDTGWAALLAAGLMLVVLFAAAYAGSLSSSPIA